MGLLADLRGMGRDRWIDAARRALQCAAATSAAWGLMRLLGREDQEFIAVLMAAMVLQRSRRGTAGAAIERLGVVAAGTLPGLAGVLLLPQAWGPWPALAVAALLAGGAPALRESWSLVMVPALALALNARDETGLETAVDQLVAFVVGLGCGLLASQVVWPGPREEPEG